MRKTHCFVFEPFRLDVLDERLWRGDEAVALGRKAFAVLQRLVRDHGRLVTKDDLLASAWPDTAVSDAVLTTAMRELRQALGDEARTPRYIQTVHGRGYRFMPLVEQTGAVAEAPFDGGRGSVSERPPPGPPAGLVGRESAWARLQEWLATSDAGSRRVGFVTGEAGIGKTALVDAFVGGLGARATVARGQCIEHYGEGEAYLPLLEALGRLGREPDTPLPALLRRYAPSWLAHLPSMQRSDEDAAGAGVAPARMLRELAETLEVFTDDRLLILVLEDLHWSDAATLDWLASMARRRDRARLLVLATCRPVDAARDDHPLRQVIAELRSQPQTAELALDALTEPSVEACLRQRCGEVAGLPGLAQRIHHRTGGLPLFVTTMVEELARRPIEAAEAEAMPAGIRQFIEHRVGQLSLAGQAILEAASVAGDTFAIAAVAAALDTPEEGVGVKCAAWARDERFVTLDTGTTGPDVTHATRYRFRHALFQEVVYARTPPERRARFHLRIGKHLERAHGARAAAIAAELAVHYDEGGDASRAVTYFEHAARNALGRSAYTEAHRQVARALARLDDLPPARARARLEIRLSLLLAQVLETVKGWGVADVEQAYARARVVSRQIGDGRHLLQATWGLTAGSIVRADIRRTRVLARELLRLAEARRDPCFTMAAHTELGGTAFVLGHAAAARRHFEEADRLYDPSRHPTYVARFGADLGLMARIWATHLRWQDGDPEHARRQADETRCLAHELGHPFSETITLAYAAMLAQFTSDLDAVEDLSNQTIAHATAHGFAYYLAWALVIRAWGRVCRGGGDPCVTEMRHNIDLLQATAGLRMPYYRALLADACLRSGRAEEGLAAVAEGVAAIARTTERWWAPELHRLRGVLLLSSAGESRVTEAERCFRTAIDLARRHGATSLERRAVADLAHLCNSAAIPNPG
jgi:DNA-binding winged helix-turn-helix (wHTH) protein/predicted ATPase